MALAVAAQILDVSAQTGVGTCKYEARASHVFVESMAHLPSDMR